MKTNLMCLCVVLAAALLGCRPASPESEGPQPVPGTFCTVSLRRDALGMAGDAVVGPRTDVFNGGEASVHGRLKRMTPEWLVLEGHPEQELWIPKQLVLMIRVATD